MNFLKSELRDCLCLQANCSTRNRIIFIYHNNTHLYGAHDSTQLIISLPSFPYSLQLSQLRITRSCCAKFLNLFKANHYLIVYILEQSKLNVCSLLLYVCVYLLVHLFVHCDSYRQFKSISIRIELYSRFYSPSHELYICCV